MLWIGRLWRDKHERREIYFSDKNYRNSLFAHLRNSTSDVIKNKEPRFCNNIFQFKT